MIHGLDLFSGIGGITIALKGYVLPLAYCEVDPYAQSVLLSRMQEKMLPQAPIWDDIRSLTIKDFPSLDIIYGGFPCQDISIARNGIGLAGERSGLFFEILRLLDESKAPWLFLENVPNIRTKGAERVCKELAERGYDCRWCCLPACDVGARHKRLRWFLLAHTSRKRRQQECESPSSNESANEGRTTEYYHEPSGRSEDVADASSERLEKRRIGEWNEQKISYSTNNGQDVPNSRCEREGSLQGCGKTQEAPFLTSRFGGQWEVEPNVGRVVDGVPFRVDRLKALGNAVVPLQARTAFEFLLFGK